LLTHTWPGSVRKLRNVLERAAILSDAGIIERRHLALYAKVAPARGRTTWARPNGRRSKRCCARRRQQVARTARTVSETIDWSIVNTLAQRASTHQRRDTALRNCSKSPSSGRSGERNAERAPLAHRALRPDSSAVSLDETFADVEAKT
jgi:DNA-binding NtrC family response regulator